MLQLGILRTLYNVQMPMVGKQGITFCTSAHGKALPDMSCNHASTSQTHIRFRIHAHKCISHVRHVYIGTHAYMYAHA